MVATRTVVTSNDPCMAESLGIKTALEWIEESSWTNLVIELNAKQTMDCINKHCFPRSYLGKISRSCLEKIKSL